MAEPTREPTAGSRSPSGRWPGRWLGPALLLVASAGALTLGLIEAWHDSPTFDEPVYVSSGVVAVLHHDLTLNDEHPPLPKVLAALPVLAVHPVVPAETSWTRNDEHSYSARFAVAQLDAHRLRQVTFASRLVPLVEMLAVAWVAYALAASLFGAAAGALAGLLWLGSAFVLGLGHLDGTDLPFALAVVATSWALERWLRRRSGGALAVVGVCGGLAVSCQSTGLLVLLVAIAVVVVSGWRRAGVRRALGQGGTLLVVAFVVLWVPYAVLEPSTVVHPWGLLPRPWVEGLAYLQAHDTSPSPAYVAGYAYDGRRWWFWPLSLVVKYPLTTLIVLVAGVAAWWWVDRGSRRRALAVVALPGAVLACFTVLVPQDLGLRYLLPVLALWCAGAGALMPAVRAMRPPLRSVSTVALAVLVAASVASTVASFPDSLAWTSAPFRPGYAAASNSDLDWGQSLYALDAWARGRRPWVAYFGPRGLSAHVPGTRPLLGAAPGKVRGWVAVSATALTSEDREQLAWLRRYCPVGTLGGSVLVFHLAQPPGPSRAARAAAPAPAAPRPVCPGSWSEPSEGATR